MWILNGASIPNFRLHPDSIQNPRNTRKTQNLPIWGLNLLGLDRKWVIAKRSGFHEFKVGSQNWNNSSRFFVAFLLCHMTAVAQNNVKKRLELWDYFTEYSNGEMILNEIGVEEKQSPSKISFCWRKFTSPHVLRWVYYLENYMAACDWLKIRLVW